MKAELLAQVKALDPTPLDADMPAGAWSAALVLHEIERRTGMETRDTTKATPPGVTQKIDPSTKPGAFEKLAKEKGKRRWSGALVGAAAFAVVVIVGVVILLASRGGDELAPATPSTTQAPVTAPPFSGEEALAVTDAYFEAYNAGNVGAVAALFTPDVTIQWFGDVSQSEFEMITAFYAGQGTTLTPPDCSVTDQVPGESATVRCDFDTLTGLTQAVGGPLIPTQFTAVVTLDGIRNLFFFYREINFLHVGAPFGRWMEERNPENAAAVEFGNWTTVDEARETGLLTAQFADEWAAYLDANDCAYNEVCSTFTVDEALAVKDAYIAAYNAGDADAVLALFAPDPRMSGVGALSLVTFERRLAWKIAQGTTATASECTANELEDAVSLLCGFTNHQYSAVAVGAPPVEGNLTLIVSRDGIRSHSEGLAPQDFEVVNSPFEHWLEENHPEDISIVLCCGGWDSVAQAEQGGILHARYADEWVAYLEANGCTYTDTDC